MAEVHSVVGFMQLSVTNSVLGFKILLLGKGSIIGYILEKQKNMMLTNVCKEPVNWSWSIFIYVRKVSVGETARAVRPVSPFTYRLIFCRASPWQILVNEVTESYVFCSGLRHLKDTIPPFFLLLTCSHTFSFFSSQHSRMVPLSWVCTSFS